ncbi:MAG: NADH-quinone oxidoreductase subunit L [Gammaproteobacteria bacterium]
MIELLRWVPLVPFCGFLLLAVCGRALRKTAIAAVGVGSVGLVAVLVALIGTEFLHAGAQALQIDLGSWLSADDLSVSFGLYLDALSLTMLFIVSGVGFLIHVYSASFMAGDAGYARFFAYMNLFVAAMLLLVLADNLLLLYLGWEGVGLGSYLLIGFWYENPDNGYAARKAFVMTRIGDTSLALGLFLLFAHLHTFDMQTLMRSAAAQWPAGTVLPVAAAALLLGGALGKSAQLPLQTWLPDAMAGPTPVSALIHAATMVTAGVYLIARTHTLFMLAPAVQFCVALVGAVTLLLAGCSALAQSDIKRILAYSTISQIGYMFLALGVGAWSAAIFHLLTHAFFKALLFLAAGAVIYCYHHEHNIFNMGGLRKALPLAFWSFVIGSAALTALPFTAGYYSKHAILQAAFAVSPGLWAAGCIGALITGIYSFRLVFVAFFGAQRMAVEKTMDWRMRAPLIVLCVLALVGAGLRIPLDSVFGSSLATEHGGLDAAAAVTIAAPGIGLLLAVWWYLPGVLPAPAFSGYAALKLIQRYWRSGWGFDWLYDIVLRRPFIVFSETNRSDALDDVYTGIAQLSRGLYRLAALSQTGQVRWYAASMGFGAVALIAVGMLS